MGKPNAYIQRMYKYADKLARYVERHELTPAKLGMSEDYQWAVTTPLGVIGDSARKLLNRNVDLGPHIPLAEIADMRNRLAHDYDGVDWNYVEEAVFVDIPKLRESLAQVMRERDIPFPDE